MRNPNASGSGETGGSTPKAIVKSGRSRPRKLYLTEDEADLIDSLRSVGKKGRPIEKVIAKYGYQLED